MKCLKIVLSGIELIVWRLSSTGAVIFMLIGLGISVTATAKSVETVNMSVDFEHGSHAELIKKAWGSDCPVVIRNDKCLQLNSGSAAQTGFLSYTNDEDITVFLELKLTDIAEGNHPWELC